MPWHDEASSRKHNHKAVGKAGEQWRSVANSVLSRTGDDARAIREANSVIGRHKAEGGDVAQDKKLIEKAIHQHETQEHGGKMSKLHLRHGGNTKHGHDDSGMCGDMAEHYAKGGMAFKHNDAVTCADHMKNGGFPHDNERVNKMAAGGLTSLHMPKTSAGQMLRPSFTERMAHREAGVPTHSNFPGAPMMKKGGETKKMAKGGYVSMPKAKEGGASKRADGVAMKGKTKGKNF